MKEEFQTVSYAIGVLTVIFSTLKITGNISWNWIWVLTPLWIIPATIVVSALIIILLSAFKSVK